MNSTCVSSDSYLPELVEKTDRQTAQGRAHQDLKKRQKCKQKWKVVHKKAVNSEAEKKTQRTKQTEIWSEFAMQKIVKLY